MKPERRNWIIGGVAAAAVVGMLFVGSKLFEPMERNQATENTYSSSSRKKNNDDDSSDNFSDDDISISSSKKSSKNKSTKSSSSKKSSSANAASEKETQEQAPVDPAQYGILQYMTFSTSYTADGQGGYDINLNVNNNSYMDASFDLSKFSIENGPALVGSGSQVVPSLQSQTISLGNSGAGDPGRATYNLLYNGQVVSTITFE